MQDREIASVFDERFTGSPCISSKCPCFSVFSRERLVRTALSAPPFTHELFSTQRSSEILALVRICPRGLAGPHIMMFSRFGGAARRRGVGPARLQFQRDGEMPSTHTNWHRKHAAQRTTGQKIADTVAATMGSWTFIIIE